MSLRINQSKIKRLTQTALCPQRYYREDITCEYKRESTEAMIKGQVFEYRLTGALPPEGNIPEIPLLKKGTRSTDDIRIQAMVDRFPAIMAQYGIKIIKSGYRIEVAVTPELTFHGTLDCLVEYRGRPYIMDIKLTANVMSTFGDFAWGTVDKLHLDDNGAYVADFDPNGEGMDFIQAHAYVYQLETLTKRRFGFIYAVFDYKPKSEFKIIEVPFSEEARADMLNRLTGTKAKLEMFEAMNYRAIPSWKECKSCKISDCLVRMNTEPTEEDSYLQSILTIEDYWGEDVVEVNGALEKLKVPALKVINPVVKEKIPTLISLAVPENNVEQFEEERLF